MQLITIELISEVKAVFFCTATEEQLKREIKRHHKAKNTRGDDLAWDQAP